MPILDHTVRKKTVKETCHDEIISMSTVLPQNVMNSSHNQVSLKKQVTVNGNMQPYVDAVKDASTSIVDGSDVSHASHHGGNGLKDDDQGCSTLLPKEGKHQKVIWKDTNLAHSTSILHRLVCTFLVVYKTDHVVIQKL